MADIYVEKLISILGSRYEIGGKYAEGGMGKIYLGMHRALGKPVAIKVIDQRFSNDKKIRTRFFKEAKLVANLTHKGIIDIYDFGSREDFDFLIMPLIDGITLAKKIRRQGRLSVSESLYVTRSVAEALAFALQNQVVHRDIKPSNILIDTQDQVILTDFGICKDLSDPELTAACTIVGSPKYMSPEQVLGQPVDGRSDLYALGLVFYEMVTGRYPYKDTASKALFSAQVHDLPPDPGQIVADLTPPVNAVILKLIQKDPDHRYQNAGDLIADLRKCDARDPYAASSPPVPAGSDTMVFEEETIATVCPAPSTAGSLLATPDNRPTTDRLSPPTPAAKGVGRPLFQLRYLISIGLVLALGMALLFSLQTMIGQRTPPPVGSIPAPLESTTGGQGIDSPTIDLQKPRTKVTAEPGQAKDAEREAPYVTIRRQIMALGQDQEARFVTLWSNQSRYRIGEAISYHFKSERPCYLVLLNQTTAGEIVQIFPNQHDRKQLVEAKRTYSIPGEDLEFSLEATGPAGRDELIILASNAPFALFPHDFENEMFFQLKKNNADDLEQTLANLRTAKPIDFVQARHTYTIDE